MDYCRKSTVLFLVFLSIAFIFACKSNYFFRSNYTDATSLLHSAEKLPAIPYLKVHMRNGDVYVLSSNWQVDTTNNSISGGGQVFDYTRRLVNQGALQIPLDSVVIFETNNKLIGVENGRIAALTILTALDLTMTAVCIANPKACFGSCPTFYKNENDNFHYADAEGFSNAISPSLEYADIDAIGQMHIYGNSFSITMKNEALETHCVKDVKLIAFKINKGESINHTAKDQFFLCENSVVPNKVIADEGDITNLLLFADKHERSSLADPQNLNSKEEIILNFDQNKQLKNPGLVIHFRQSLMTTYLFYSAMGYMGDMVGDVFAALETDPKKRKKFDRVIQLLGGIETYYWNDQKKIWEFQGEVNETGPIAINKQIIPLDKVNTNENIKIKLVLNKGYWRIDQVVLTEIKKKVQAIQIPVNTIFNKGQEDAKALKDLIDPEKYLISMPGDEFKMSFKLPNTNTDWELFLSSEGYYLEWMRARWIKDKDLLKLIQMVERPNHFLRMEAKEFKKYESGMEEQFWNSRIDTKTFSYYDK